MICNKNYLADILRVCELKDIIWVMRFQSPLVYIRDHEILSALQSGLIPGDSTVNQLVDIYNTYCKSLDEDKEVRAVFCDISKAFDRVWHRGVLFKLESIGVLIPYYNGSRVI